MRRRSTISKTHIGYTPKKFRAHGRRRDERWPQRLIRWVALYVDRPIR
jgi:hypothetical protein